MRFFLFLSLLLMLVSAGAYGSGFSFDGIGVKANGMGGAFRAIADDWSAAYYNPAGYNLIQDNILALNSAFVHNRYWTTPDVLWGGIYETGFYNDQEIANNHAVLAIPQGGAVARLPILGQEMVMGFSIIQLFDQNQRWELYQNIPAHTDSMIPNNQFGINLDAVAFQFTAARGFMEDRLSVGLGLSVVRGDLVYNNVVLRENPMPSPLSDRPHDKIPEWNVNNGNGWGFGYRLGMLYDVTEKMKLGLTYAGKTSIDISGRSYFEFYMGENPYTQIYLTSQMLEELLFVNGEVIEVAADYETTLDLPATISGGISYQLTDRLTLALDAEMVFWSQFEGFEFKFSNYEAAGKTSDDVNRNRTILASDTYENAQDLIMTDLSVPIAWDDAPKLMIGADYQANNFLNVRAGFAADKSPIKWDNPGGITQIPQFFDLGTKYSYSFGLGFEVGVWKLDFASVYTHQPDIKVSNLLDQDGDGLIDNIPADYSGDNYRTLLGVSYRF